MESQTQSIGQLLVKNKLVTEQQIELALSFQKKEGGKLGSILVKQGYLKEDVLVNFLSKQLNVPAIDLSNKKIDPNLLKLFPLEKMKQYEFVPLSKENSVFKVAMSDPMDRTVLNYIENTTRMRVAVSVAPERQILKMFENSNLKKEKSNGGNSGISPKVPLEHIDITKLATMATQGVDFEEKKDDIVRLDLTETAPVVKLVNGILLNAVHANASDIHIEPAENYLNVRYRVDGVLKSVLKLPASIKNALTSRLKILSRLDIAERRIPQDGRIKLKFDKGEIDFRVSTLPILYGEKVVMRLLDKSNLQLDLNVLGFSEKQLSDFLESIEKPYGMILVTGPTGSGKTTTLYSGLTHVNKPQVNIMTAEDPVEYNLTGINQVQIRPEVGLDFASALRSFLRQDPDIIMVGEIRDFDTAEIAVKAALTGHLVLSTLHTNDAPSTITRLINMGIEPFLVSASVVLVLAQRLARKICSDCKEEHEYPEKMLLKLGFATEDLKGLTCYIGKGCDVCSNTGYKGRIALYEILTMNDELREIILDGGTSEEIKKVAIKYGMLTLRQSGLDKIKEGITTPDEILRCTFED